ncbi:MAG: response regulator [Desulfuromonadaceae bacterium]|nr:response regulator [Desulfuromonadaceae bacterium]
MRCLVVDDSGFEREMMGFFLADYAETDSACDGKEAVDMFSRALAEGRPYQLVCLDILMPNMNGQEALKKMRETEAAAGNIEQKAIIIMTTAMNSREDMEEAIWGGDCNDYLVKPVILADLVALMHKYKLIQ